MGRPRLCARGDHARMYEIYSNLRACVEGIGQAGSMDSHIALYVLEHHEEVPHMAIGDLARACNTSIATISRFCRRVNGSDWTTFKDQMEEYGAWLRSDSAASRFRDRIDIPWYFDTLEASIYQTRQLLTDDVLEQAVDWLSEAANVYIYGSSFSNITACEACEKLNRINRLCFSFSTVKDQIGSLVHLKADDLVVFISFSGTTPHIRRLYRQAKMAGCRIMWISGNGALVREGSSREMLVAVSPLALHEYRTSLVEGISLHCAIDALYIRYTNRLRAARPVAPAGLPVDDAEDGELE